MGKTIQVYGFPSLVAAENVKNFLENHTGRGTVEAIEVKKPRNGGQRAYARVQFTSVRSADHIISLAAQRLWYGSSYLKAKRLDLDIAPKPRVYAHEMESITIYFGCQVSKEKFSVLWKNENVSVKFGFGLRKMYFILSHLNVEYKLELAYENIWQIELRCPSGQSSEFLLIQLLGAPRIYGNEKSIFSYFSETPDDQWARATDFTPSCCISHSSSLCLKFPHGLSLPNFREYFAYYTENRRPFTLGNSSTFSPNSKLAPIVGPPPEIVLPYNILFKICMLVQQGCLPGPSLGTDFFRLVDPRRRNIAQIEHALEKLYYSRECCYEPAKWLDEEYQKYLLLRRLPRTPSIALDSGLVYVRRVQVTPCKVYFCGPEINMSNRVLRNFAEDIDNFLRVSFLDEELDKMHSNVLSARSGVSGASRTNVYARILTTLRDGIVIGKKKFDFLAFSSSQLRESSAWMFASRPGLCAADIRRWMGEFAQIRNVAKYAARLGQSFSSSTESLSVSRHEIEVIPDVEVVRGGTTYTFSDGIGKISADLARRVAVKCGLRTTPSAFQIRYGGYKGVVAVDPTSSVKLSLRKSMSKYESENSKLDILAFSKYQPCYLNRQLISLLSTLEVRDYMFEKKQKEAIDELNTILTDPLRAQEALELMSPGENTNILKEMLLCGYKPDGEPFLSMMLQTFRAAKLLELRTKTRIYIPRGRSMMGCLDETRTLEYGQVFVQISGAGHRTFGDNSFAIPGDIGSSRRIVEGKVFVAKNPCLHPGDVRVLQAVNVPALHHMVDCVVFPQKGMRPHPNECSGSDLDGDIYFVCWDPDLIPTKQIQPMDYTPAPTEQLDHDVTIEEVEEYFTNYILNNSLGVIANAHTVFADKKPNKAMSAECLKLANLFSIAVDFPKTGVPAEIPRELRVQEYPDFMEKPDKTTYVSENVIGKLFRQVKDMAPHSGPTKSFFTKELAMRSYDADMEVDGFEDYLDDAFDYKNEYDFKLGNLMDYYGIKTEAEILGGSIMKMSRTFDRRRDAEAVGLAVRALRKEARTWFGPSRIDEDDEGDDDADAKASAWYHVTYHHSYVGRYNEGMKRPHFLSFPWCVYDRLIRIKKDKARMRRARNLSSLERQFGNGLILR